MYLQSKYILRELANAHQRCFPQSKILRYKEMPTEIVDQAVKDAFTSLDRIIIDGGAEAAVGDRFLNDAMCELSPSYSGSCALVSDYLTMPCCFLVKLVITPCNGF